MEIREEFKQTIKEFKQELIIAGYSEKTLEMYLIYVNNLLNKLGKKPEEINGRDLIGYLADKKEEGRSNATLSLIHSAMRYFFKEYLKMNIIDDIKTPKKSKSLPKVLSKEEVKKLFKTTKFGRNRLMLQFMYGSGCRVSEVVKLKVDDINLKEKTAIVKGGKGNKDRLIILSKNWIKDLKKYLNKKKIKSEFVFSKKNGSQLSSDTIQRIVRESAKKAGITKHVTPHSLRHSYATHLLEAGVNIRYIQTLLGHSNLNTTQIYTNVAGEQLKKIESPLDSMK
jgi:integrase/recombinase XerD